MALTFPLTEEDVLRLASVRTAEDFFAFSLDGPTEFDAKLREPAGIPGTFEDLLALSGKAERVDGRIFVVAPSNFEHAETQSLVLGLIQGYVAIRRLGHVVGERFLLRLDGEIQRSPDVAFFRPESLGRVHLTYVEGGADFVVEIVSPSSAKIDRIKKRAEYAAAGIEEYLIVDPTSREVELLRLKGGEYRPVAPDAVGRLHSSAITGFWLRPEWPLSGRSAYELVGEILAAEGDGPTK